MNRKAHTQRKTFFFPPENKLVSKSLKIKYCFYYCYSSLEPFLPFTIKKKKGSKSHYSCIKEILCIKLHLFVDFKHILILF